MVAPPAVQVLDADDRCPVLPIVQGDGVARAVVWPGTGAELRTMHLINLQPGSRTVTLRHPSEAVYYVISGEGVAIGPDDRSEQPLVEGSMIHVEPGTGYVIRAGDPGLELLGGPCPADPSLYRTFTAS